MSTSTISSDLSDTDPTGTHPARSVRAGVFLPTMTAPGHPLGDVVAAARLAEDAGLESVWVVEQLVAGAQPDRLAQCGQLDVVERVEDAQLAFADGELSRQVW